MLVSFSCENILSFKDNQFLSMKATTKKKDNILLENISKKSSKESLLESALIFGANGSGKTNLLAALSSMANIVLHSLESLKKDTINYLPPFLLDGDSRKSPSEFEIEFYSADNIKYRYGISLKKDKVIEEWLYYTPNTRETLLFHRENNSIELNNSFEESLEFVDKNSKILKTKDNVAFISVLASFNGYHSNQIIDWFASINFLDINNTKEDLKNTLLLWRDDESFKEWVCPILDSIGIKDITFDHHSIENVNEIKSKIKEQKEKLEKSEEGENKEELKNKALSLFNNLIDFMNESKIDESALKKEIDLNSVKLIRIVDDVEYPLPIQLESSGTQKLLHILGNMYASYKHGNLLVIDELDVKFHTLLTKYIFKIFHGANSNGQIIATVHDTNLMDTNYFRRDQIWLMNKNERGESKIYSLVEFKELVSNISNKNYSNEYLNGFYDAIPLFEDLNNLSDLME